MRKLEGGGAVYRITRRKCGTKDPSRDLISVNAWGSVGAARRYCEALGMDLDLTGSQYMGTDCKTKEVYELYIH